MFVNIKLNQGTGSLGSWEHRSTPREAILQLSILNDALRAQPVKSLNAKLSSSLTDEIMTIVSCFSSHSMSRFCFSVFQV